MHVVLMMTCEKNASTKLSTSALGPPDEFVAGDGTASTAWVLASKGGGGGCRGDCREGDLCTLLIVQLGSRCSPQTHDVVVVTACSSVKKYGTHIM